MSSDTASGSAWEPAPQLPVGRAAFDYLLTPNSNSWHFPRFCKKIFLMTGRNPSWTPFGSVRLLLTKTPPA